MSCGGCGRVVAVQVPLFGGVSDDAWHIRPKGDTYTVRQGLAGNVQDPAQNALRYLKQQAEPFGIRGCPSWLLTAVQQAPASADLVSQHVAKYLAVGGLGDDAGGWGTFGPLGSVGGALATTAATTGTIDGGGFEADGVNLEYPAVNLTGTIGADAVDIDVPPYNAPITGNIFQSAPFAVTLESAAAFRNVVALPAVCCPVFPLPANAGWTLALRLAADAGLGAIIGRDVVLTLAGRMPCSCSCSTKTTGHSPEPEK